MPQRTVSNLRRRLFKSLLMQAADEALHNVSYYDRRRWAIGVIAIIGFPLYYFVWRDLYPQAYENLALRLLGAGLFIPLIVSHRWPSSCKRYLPLLWHFTLLYSLPFFFFYMLLKNDGSAVWVASTMIALFAMTLLLDWFFLLVHFALGALLALGAYLLTTEAPQLAFSSANYLPIFPFAVIFGAAVNYTSLVVKTEQEHAMVATAGSIAHELRTPLMSVAASASGLRHFLPTLIAGYKLAQAHQLVAPPIRRIQLDSLETALDRIVNETEQANRIIEMLLVTVRPNGSLAEHMGLCSMRTCVTTALERYPFTPGEAELIDVGSVDFAFRGNELLMIHLLFNLIKNALRHIAVANKGRILMRSEPTAHGHRLIFRDTGMGIPADQLPHIFKRFYSTADASGSLLGSGIGLAFCRDVMSQLEGRIECHSVPGEYTEFILSFPPP